MTLIDRILARLRRGERPVRYLLAGAANTAFGLGFFPALLWVSPWFARNYMAALVLSQVICVGFAFSTYKIGVFRTRTNILREFAYFSSFYYAVFGANLIALPLLVQGLGLHPIPAQLSFGLITLVGSYFWHRAVTFRSDKPT
ncbi:MAG: GtrA family protein [Novosphingobium sp.]